MDPLTLTLIAGAIFGISNVTLDHLNGEEAKYTIQVDGGTLTRDVKIKTKQGSPFFEVDGERIWVAGKPPPKRQQVITQVSMNWSP